jgi:hypothetical protein
MLAARSRVARTLTDLDGPIRALIGDYARLAVVDDWPMMRTGERSPETDRALGALLQTALAINLGSSWGSEPTD